MGLIGANGTRGDHLARRGAAGIAGAAMIFMAGFAPETRASEVPRVVTDIAPVHSLVAQVMGDLGTPELLLPPGSSPHHHALRPSQAASLQEADLVIHVGGALTPWLDDALGSLAADAGKLGLIELEETIRLEVRLSARFPGHAHGEEHHAGHEHGDDHDHGKHDGHGHGHGHGDGHGDHKGHAHGDAHGQKHEHGHGHDGNDTAHGNHQHDAQAEHVGHGRAHAEGGIDAHAWLDPANAGIWLRAIATRLSAADPPNAERYGANAEAALAELEALQDRVRQTVEPVRGRPFIVLHDAYQYFERRFDLAAAGSVSVSDAVKPSAARVAEIAGVVEELGAVCLFAEPQLDDRILQAVAGGSGARLGVLDPVGSALTPGPDLYGRLIEELAGALAGCLGDPA